MKKIKKYLQANRLNILALSILLIITLATNYFSYKSQANLAYNDSMAHLNVSRLVIDNLEPGLAQLGSVWLPLNHLLSLPLIWNNWAWHSGFAGGFISTLAFIFSVIGIYKIIILITKQKYPALIGAFAFTLNVNMLYLQTTALTESLYLFLVIWSIYYQIKYFKTEHIKDLITAGFFAGLQVLTRYDGWFVVIVQALVFIGYFLMSHKKKLQDIIGMTLTFIFPVLISLFLWLLWNLLIYDNPLYFMLGPYSARAQQNMIAAKGELVTKGDFFMSLKAIILTTLANIGPLLIILAFIGIVLFLLRNKRSKEFKIYLIALILLTSPILFNFVALYFGFSILNIPGLSESQNQDPDSLWFNVRYGIMLLPTVAVGIGLFATQHIRYIFLAIVIIITQNIVLFKTDIITMTDGLYGSSSYKYSDISDVLKANVRFDQKVLLSTALYNPVAFKSELNLNQIIHEGVSKEWNYAIVNPEKYSQWLLMSNGDTGEPLYTSLVKNQNNRFLENYSLFFKGKHANVYKFKEDNEIMITRKDSKLQVLDKSFVAKGVNSYDLAYQTNESIDDTFKDLYDIGVNTIRFWLFGDGNNDGFQPQAGIINEERFRQVDYIIYNAHKYNMRLIPVLSNNWNDYGGKFQYLRWLGLETDSEDEFFTNANSKSLFQNYLNFVLTRKNTITNNYYSDDSAILAWDLMNEPRANDVTNIVDWVKENIDYIRSHDQNHLITISLDKGQTHQANTYFGQICEISSLDMCSLHLFLNDNNTLIFKDMQTVNDYLAEIKLTATNLSKPIIVSEFGVSKAEMPFNQDPLAIMNSVAKTIASEDYNGLLIWNWSQTPDESFGFAPNSQTDEFTDQDLKEILTK